jgi:sec-independent protein translocase protein TatC
MASPEEPKGEESPAGGPVSPTENTPATPQAEEPSPYTYYDESYTYDPVPAPPGEPVAVSVPPVVVNVAPAGGGHKKPPPDSKDKKDDEDDEGMLRMSFLGHLEELRKRIFLMLIGVGIAFMASLTFCEELWGIVSAPAVSALTTLGIKPPELAQITPMEAFNVIWFKLPTLVAVFLSSPWILYQVWAFIAPGLYKKERRFAAPFVICSAGLFIMGGCFAYFVAFRFGLTFLLGIGITKNVRPLISIDEYFNMFVNVTLGIAIVFELPILIFFLTLLRVVTPKFLIAHSRYAILGIVILAAIITPTPDVFNLMLFATPMCVLFYAGIFASYILVLKRENRSLPWKKIGLFTLVVFLLLFGLCYLAISRYHYHYVGHWPFLTR